MEGGELEEGQEMRSSRETVAVKYSPESLT